MLKYRVTLEMDGQKVDQVIIGEDAEAVVRNAKLMVAKKLPWLKRAFVKNMGNVSFAQEVVRRYNKKFKRSDALPQSAEGFIAWAISRQFARAEGDM